MATHHSKIHKEIVTLKTQKCLLWRKDLLNQLRFFISSFILSFFFQNAKGSVEENSGDDENKKNSMVRWKNICKSKEEGGLGVKKLNLFNDVLLTKWKWNLLHQKDSLWGQVLTSKYGGWHGLMGNSALSWKSLWWKDLKKLCGSEVDNPWFDENILWKIGRGDKCRFWKDVWVMG